VYGVGGHEAESPLFPNLNAPKLAELSDKAQESVLGNENHVSTLLPGQKAAATVDEACAESDP
jgi:hypothetical protein